MITLLSFLFVLGVLVFVHELGHFLVARFYGVRVITFSLGFGPKILKVTRGGTEYCVSIVPLGGYVKLAGETVDEKRTGAPDEFLSKSRWIRFQVYLAGPVMNLMLAVVLVAITLSGGANVPLYRSAPAVIGIVNPASPAAEAGLRAGDRIVSVDEKPVATWDALDLEVLPKARRELTFAIVRDGQPTSVKVTPTATGHFEIGDIGIQPVMRPVISQVNAGSPAASGGVQAGDVIVAVGGVPGLLYDQIVQRIRASASMPLVLTVERAGTSTDLTVVPKGSPGAAMIGVSISPYEVRRIDPTFVQAIQLSLRQNWENTVLIGRTLRGLITRDTPVRQLMGPVGIAQLSGSAAEMGLGALLGLMAMISLNLGLFNLVPLPVLDGGHIAILAVEGVMRRNLNEKLKERVLMTGAALIVLLMVTVIYNDIARLLR